MFFLTLLPHDQTANFSMLRETAIELQMPPIRSFVHLPVATLWTHFQGGDVEKGFAEQGKSANAMADDRQQ